MFPALEPKHRIDALLHFSVVLLNEVVQVLAHSHLRALRQDVLSLQFTNRGVSRRIAVDGDLLWWTMLLYRLGEELLGGGDVSVLAEEEVNGESLLIDRSIEISQSPLDFDVRFVHSPCRANRSSMATPAFLDLWNVTLNPSEDCCVG